MFTRTTVQSPGWRFFALICIPFALLFMPVPGSPTEWARSAAGAIAVLGLVGYAFGFRLGPALFWRAFAILFSVAVLVRTGSVTGPKFAHYAATPADSAGWFAALAILLMAFAFLSLALFRHSGLVPDSGRSGGKGEPEPLFPVATSEGRAQIVRAYADAKAVAEGPMAPEVEAEALSFGPGRRRSLKQHQRLTTTLWLGMMGMQVLLEALYDGVAVIIAPAIVLGVGAAAATYSSGEVIARAQPTLTKAWKLVALLAVITAGTYIPDDPDSIKLWFAKVVLTDTAFLCIGGLLISTDYAFRRRRRI